jgi:type I restriction enzyme S subunit
MIKTAFLARWLESADAQTWLHSKYRGIDMPGLNVRDVRRLPVPLAPLDEQEEVGRLIGTAFAWIDRITSETTSARRLIDHLDQAILAKAFRGELVPQDPNDEPASVLLERIRAGRQATPIPRSRSEMEKAPEKIIKLKPIRRRRRS